MSEARVRTKWGVTLGVAAGAAVLVAVIVLAFLWPTVTSSVRSFPIGVTGDSSQVEAFQTALEENAEGRFDVTVMDDRSDIVDAVGTREIYGGVVIGDEPEVLTATGGGAVQTQVMSQLQAQLQTQIDTAVAAGAQDAIAQASQAAAAGQIPTAQALQIVQQASAAAGPTVALTDLAPLAETDSRGVGFAAAAFPTVLGGMIGGILISFAVTGSRRRLGAIVAYSLVAGVIVTAVLQPWFGILQGSFLANWMAMSLAFLGTGSLIVGANAVFGRAGIAIGALTTMFIGNPIASVTQPLQFLPEPWGAIGQYFVPGASATLLRDLSYFPDAPQLQSWLVLVGWAVLGTVMMLVGHFRSQEVVHIDGSVEDDVRAEPVPA